MMSPFKPLRGISLLRLIIVSALFIYIGTYASLEIADSDFWLHVKSGEVILKQHTFLQQDPFSFTRPGATWVNHEWLSQVILYWFFSHWQYDGLVFFKIAVYLSAFLFLYFYLARTCHYLFASVLVMTAFVTGLHRLMPRPDILSFLLFVVYIFILGQHKGRFFWLLPCLQLFWVNTHGFFIVGVATVFLYWVAIFVQRNSFSAEHRRRSSYVLMACIAVCFLNPNGYAGILYPLSRIRLFFSGRERIIYSMIMELRSPFQGKLIGASVFKVLLVCSPLSFLLTRRSMNVFYFLLTIVMGFFASSALRNMNFFGPVGVIALSDNILAFIRQSSAVSLCERVRIQKIMRGVIVAGSALFVALIFQDLRSKFRTEYAYYDEWGLKRTKTIFWGYQGGKYPEQMKRFMENAALPERMFNSFNIGSYLIGNFYPQRKVFVDGRTEF